MGDYPRGRRDDFDDGGDMERAMAEGADDKMGRRGPRRFHRGKVCAFCVDKAVYIDYKDLEKIRRFVSDRGKILPRRITGNCAIHQRMVTTAIKRARSIALIPNKAR